MSTEFIIELTAGLVLLGLVVAITVQYRRQQRSIERGRMAPVPTIKDQYPPRVEAALRNFNYALTRRSDEQWARACNESLERSLARRGRR